MMTRQKGEGAPLKYMGHGLCDNISKSVTLPTPTNSAVLLSRYCFQLLHAITVSAQDIRGMGIQVGLSLMAITLLLAFYANF